MNSKTALINKLGFAELTKVQKQVVEIKSDFNDMILYAPTGSGKTLAYLVSVIEQMTPYEPNQFRTLILAPTRELAIQIEQVFKSLKTEHTVTTCYGGHAVKTEINNLSANPSVIIGTPGRITDLVRRKVINLGRVENFVVDEFDKCLELGFQKEIEVIYIRLKSLKRKYFCSATKIAKYPSFIKLNNPVYIDVLTETINPSLAFFKVTSEHKTEALDNLILSFESEPTIVFCNFREDVDNLKVHFDNLGMVTESYHGGKEQDERERSLIKFKNGSAPVLICTDLGARGLDISNVKNIVHYQLPKEEASFIHRNGRTARMNENGSVYLFSEDMASVAYDFPPLSNFSILKANKYNPPKWTTVYFSAGKKDKINKIDLLGFICKKGMVDKLDVGVITVLDFQSFVAIDTDKLAVLLPELRKHKIKGKKVLILVAK